jgi:hypothetical protein
MDKIEIKDDPLGRLEYMRGLGFRALQLNLVFRVRDLAWRDQLRYAWGFDIWLDRVPVCKTILLANIIMWVLLWVTK